MQTLVDSLTKFISEHTEFSQDVFVAILGVVIGLSLILKQSLTWNMNC